MAGGGRRAAVCLDPSEPRIVVVEASAGAANPLLDPGGEAAYVPVDDGVWRMGLDGSVEEVVRMPLEVLGGRHLFRLVTDLTRTADGRFFAGDQNPYHRTGARPCRVFFFDRETGRDVAVVSAMALPAMPPRQWRRYHLDPHPHFSPDGALLVYTTTVRGRVDVAVAPVEGLRTRL